MSRLGSTSGTDSTLRAEAKTYGFNHKIDASATLIYLVKSKSNGAWLIQKVDETANPMMTYATITNNPTVTTYPNAVANYLTLTYGLYHEAF